MLKRIFIPAAVVVACSIVPTGRADPDSSPQQPQQPSRTNPATGGPPRAPSRPFGGVPAEMPRPVWGNPPPLPPSSPAQPPGNHPGDGHHGHDHDHDHGHWGGGHGRWWHARRWPYFDGPFVFSLGYWFTPDAWYVGSSWPGGIDPFVLPTGTQVEPAPVAEPPPAMTSLDAADQAYRMGGKAVDEAVRQYRAHLRAQPDDVRTMRVLACALMDAGSPGDGVDMLFSIYEANPAALKDTRWMNDLPGRDDGLHKRFLQAVSLSGRATTPNAAFIAAIFAMTEGRSDVARRMLTKANSQGLSKPLSDELGHALAPVQPPKPVPATAAPAPKPVTLPAP